MSEPTTMTEQTFNRLFSQRLDRETSEGHYTGGFTYAIRAWLRRELPSLIENYDDSCEYGREIHLAGKKVIDAYVTNSDDNWNAPLVSMIREVVRDMQEADSREADEAARPSTAELRGRLGEPVPAGRVGRPATDPQTADHRLTSRAERSNYDRDPIPIANVSILVLVSYYGAGIEDGRGEACMRSTLSVAIESNRTTFGDRVIVDEDQGHGIFRITNLPATWLQDLAQRGSIDRRVYCSPSDTASVNSTQIRFESRVQ